MAEVEEMILAKHRVKKSKGRKGKEYRRRNLVGRRRGILSTHLKQGEKII